MSGSLFAGMTVLERDPRVLVVEKLPPRPKPKMHAYFAQYIGEMDDFDFPLQEDDGK